MCDLSFEKLCSSEKHRVIFRGVWGSHAFGTATPESDQDTMGVFIMRKSHYLVSGEPVPQYMRQLEETGDVPLIKIPNPVPENWIIPTR